ncbi:hypothetical protein C8J56DRAFT_349545 [Mycena floridula]|nr:hypothetical protein C8J56DRAFT_349545 [Mycena floridula]
MGCHSNLPFSLLPMDHDLSYNLSQEQLASFDRDGYLVLPSLSKEMTDNIVSWANEVKNLPHRSDAWMHYEEVSSTGQRILYGTENFVNHHDGFNRLFRGKAILGLLSQLTGEEMVLLKEKINYKAPSGAGFQPHTDAPAFNHVAQVKHLSVAMAVDAATLENGCLEIVAGSHKTPIPVGEDVCIPESWCKSQTWTPIPLRPGEFLIFGSYLAHRSGPNNSPHGRAAVYATYNALSEGGDMHDAYYAHRRQYWPPTADRNPNEKYEMGAKLYGFGSGMLSIDADRYASIGL